MRGKDVIAEADTLVVYGEFVVVVQAKSKRITVKAKAGDIDALKIDFDGAVQAPYRQALHFLSALEDGCQCLTSNGHPISIPKVKRAFPLVVLSDPFPGITFLSGRLLQKIEQGAPAIWDIGVLDCVTQLLPTPVDFLFYLKSRSGVFDHIHSDSEYNFLGYHLQGKLARAPEFDFMMIDRDFATVVDDYMIAMEVGAKVSRPTGILDRIDIPIIGDLLRALKAAPPDLVSIVIDLYDFSSRALEDLGGHISTLREEVKSGKPFKSFSIPTETGGITYVVARRDDDQTRLAAKAIAEKYKYDNKRDRWYVIMDSIETPDPVDAVLRLVRKWCSDDRLSENSRVVTEMFSSRRADIQGTQNLRTEPHEEQG
jgi:hypothetical protein